jgi:uncharacterized membrane protein YdjX (TVP38/TMEM64 family)
VAFLPGTVLSFAGAVLFGAYEGTLYTWIGATVGATVAYLTARVLGRDFVERPFGGRFAAFDRRIRKHGLIGLLVVRLLPLFPFNAVNFGCGLTGIRLRDYVLATAVGIVPGTFVYQFLFAKFGRKILTEGLRLAYLKDPELWLALGLFAAFVIVGKWLSDKVSRKAGRGQRRRHPTGQEGTPEPTQRVRGGAQRGRLFWVKGRALGVLRVSRWAPASYFSGKGAG